MAVVRVLRLDESTDNIENLLFSILVDSADPVPSRIKDDARVSGDPLASCTWKDVPPENTLITPVQCKALWKQFVAETEYKVTQAISAQEAYKRGNNWLLPPWAMLVMIVLGFNEFMLLLRNPVYLVVIFVTFLLGKAIWVQTDVSGLFQNGFVAGLIALPTRFFPTVMNVLRRFAGEDRDRSEEN